MSLQLSWGFTSLCTTAGNTLCIASPWPRKRLHPLTWPSPFSFKMKVKAAATRVISSILMLTVLP